MLFLPFKSQSLRGNICYQLLADKPVLRISCLWEGKIFAHENRRNSQLTGKVERLKIFNYLFFHSAIKTSLPHQGILRDIHCLCQSTRHFNLLCSFFVLSSLVQSSVSYNCHLQEVAHGDGGDTNHNGGDGRSVTRRGAVWLGGGAVGRAVGRVAVAGVITTMRAGDGSSSDTSGVGADGGVDGGGVGGEGDISTLQTN